RASSVGEGGSDRDRLGAMNLVERGERRAGQHRVDRAAAIFGDGGAVIARAKPNVEATKDTRGNAARATKEAVREGRERCGADRIGTRGGLSGGFGEGHSLAV